MTKSRNDNIHKKVADLRRAAGLRCNSSSRARADLFRSSRGGSAPGVPERLLTAAGYDLAGSASPRTVAFILTYLASNDSNGSLASFNAVAIVSYMCLFGDQGILLSGNAESSMEDNTQTSVGMAKKMEAREAQLVTERSIKWLRSPEAKAVKDECAYLHAHFKP